MEINQKIAFVGMTHLGINSAVACAEKGFYTTCFDTDDFTISLLKAGKPIVSEPNLSELLKKNVEKLTFTSSPEFLSNCDLIYISADVPTDDFGNSDLSGIDGLISLIAKYISNDAHCIILSQVPPGFTRNKINVVPSIMYQVETLIFGNAIERALYPERFILGLADTSKSIPKTLENYLNTFGCPILTMGYESAELAKISINCCLVSSISVANTLSEICEGIGADWSEIVPALKLDKRIGQFAYLKPGLGIAGGNLERDLNTVIRISKTIESDYSVVASWLRNSHHRLEWVQKILISQGISKKQKVKLCFWGLTYKENTNSLKNSPAIANIKALSEHELVAYDPTIAERLDLFPNLLVMNDPIVSLDSSKALIVMTPWPIFSAIDSKIIIKHMKNKVVIDPFAVLDGPKLESAGVQYFTLGK